MKILFLFVLLSLTACGQKDPVESSETSQEPTSQAVEEEVTESEQSQASEEEGESEESEYEGEYSILSGLPNPKGNDFRNYGVIIDNHANARPQSGLSIAPIVYEYEVESEITRYLAIFGSEEVGQIGPIRSLRPYFIDTASEYDAVIVRFGGSDQADEEVIHYGIDEINGMKHGQYIWRESSIGKVAPHNAYTSSESIRSGIENLGYETNVGQAVFNVRTEYEDLQGQTRPARSLSLRFSDYESMSYEYDEDENNYIRSINGQVQIDEYTKEEIRPENIIILFMGTGYMENGIHRWMANTGQGSGIYISGGLAKPIIWEKEDRSARTNLSYEDGSELVLNPGQTWVEMFDSYKEYNIE